MTKFAKLGWAAVVAGCVGLAIWGDAGPETNVLALCAEPFVLVGAWLRALSLSGAAGNALALGLYAFISLSPLLYMLLRRRWGWMSALVSVYLFFLLFMMVNPSKIGMLFHPQYSGPEALKVQRALLVMLLYMLLLSWLLIRAASSKDSGGLARGLIRLLWWLGALLIASALYIDLAALKAALVKLGSAAAEPDLMMGPLEEIPQTASADGFLAVVRFLASAMPSLVLLWVIPAAGRLLAGCGRELFAEGNIPLAHALMWRARAAIWVAVFCSWGAAFWNWGWRDT